MKGEHESDGEYGEYKSYEHASAFEYGRDHARDVLADRIDELRNDTNRGRREIDQVTSRMNFLWQCQVKIESALAIATDDLRNCE